MMQRLRIGKAIGVSVSLLFLLALISCGGSGSLGSGDSDQGEIIYQVSYPDLDPDGVLVTMLPEELKITFIITVRLN